MAGRKLGRGLKFLLSETASEEEVELEAAPESRVEPTANEAATESRSLLRLPCEQIRANPHQPRRVFDAEELKQLAHSLKEQGLIQPIVVRREGDSYQLIAGERRLRAAKLAGLEEIPAFVRQVDDYELRLLALVENLQRSDLDPIEKARAFQELKESSGLTHQKLAEEVGLERSSVSNYLRLLELPQSVQERIARRELSMGHARALLAAAAEERVRLAARVVEQELSVRETERLARTGLERPSHADPSTEEASKARAPSSKAAWARDMEEQLKQVLGCPVQISYRQGKGKIQLNIASRDEFTRIYELLLDKLPS